MKQFAIEILLTSTFGKRLVNEDLFAQSRQIHTPVAEDGIRT